MVTEGEQGTEVSWVDVVVICALSVEFQALSEKLTPHPEFRTDIGLGLDHFIALGGSCLTVLVVRLPEPGAGNVISGIVASLLITRYDPWLLISFGIAGTLDPGEVSTSDVLYSRVIFYLDLRKETTAGLVLKRIVPRETPMPLLRMLRKLTVKGYSLREVDIVTGEAVVKDEKAQLRQMAGNSIADAKAVDMESFGVFHASHVDEEFLTGTRRLCLAIKSISDNADQDKSDEHQAEYQAQASRNAAHFLFTLLNEKEADLAVLRRKVGLDLRPRRLQPFIRLRPRDVLDRVKLFSDIGQPIVRPDWDDSTLHAVHMHCRRPRIFYHWRLTGMGLHWVEYKFARVLRRLSDAGYPVECLITDEFLGMPQQQLRENQIPEAREVTRRIIDALLPSRSESVATFYCRIREDDEEIPAYARAAGYWSSEIRKKLGVLGSIPSMQSAKLSDEFNEWLQYIAWRARHEGACVVFYFCDREIYSLLWRFSGLLPALVPTAECKLAGEWGKFGSPGKDLFLLPPDHSAIVQWLAVTSDPTVLREFWSHLTAQEGLTEDALVRERRAWAGHSLAGNVPRRGDPAWIEQFRTQEERTSEYYKGAILLELAWLNATFFTDFRERSDG